MVCYLPTTACVLAALRAVGYDMGEPWVDRAVTWVESKQNADGGWGELPEAFEDPASAGIGPSMPALTGLVAMGLGSSNDGEGSFCRAIDYLLSHRNAAHTWDDDDWLQVLMLPEVAAPV